MNDAVTVEGNERPVFFVDHVNVLEHALGTLARRNRKFADDAVGHVGRDHLLDDDIKVLRLFQGLSERRVHGFQEIQEELHSPLQLILGESPRRRTDHRHGHQGRRGHHDDVADLPGDMAPDLDGDVRLVLVHFLELGIGDGIIEGQVHVPVLAAEKAPALHERGRGFGFFFFSLHLHVVGAFLENAVVIDGGGHENHVLVISLVNGIGEILEDAHHGRRDLAGTAASPLDEKFDAVSFVDQDLDVLLENGGIQGQAPEGASHEKGAAVPEDRAHRPEGEIGAGHDLRRDELVYVHEARHHQVIDVAFVARHDDEGPLLRGLADFLHVLDAVDDIVENLAEQVLNGRVEEFDIHDGKIRGDFLVVFIRLLPELLLRGPLFLVDGLDGVQHVAVVEDPLHHFLVGLDHGSEDRPLLLVEGLEQPVPQMARDMGRIIRGHQGDLFFQVDRHGQADKGRRDALHDGEKTADRAKIARGARSEERRLFTFRVLVPERDLGEKINGFLGVPLDLDEVLDHIGFHLHVAAEEKLFRKQGNDDGVVAFKDVVDVIEVRDTEAVAFMENFIEESIDPFYESGYGLDDVGRELQREGRDGKPVLPQGIGKNEERGRRALERNKNVFSLSRVFL